MKLRHLARIDRSARRSAEIFGVLAKYGLADWLTDVEYDWLRSLLKDAEGEAIQGISTPERIRRALSDLGTSFIKVGQILSTRPDLVGPELTDELAQLQQKTRPDDFETVVKIIQADLGAPPTELFESFDEEPLASASIGQVHCATLKGGSEVVVKIMHEGIDDVVERDLDILLAGAELMEKHAPQLRRYQPVATARYFQRTLLRELDFAYERRHLEQFADNFAEDSTVHFPEVFPELCSSRVLTMERLCGITVADRVRLRESGADLVEFARRGANVFLEMIFRDGFYHADPHPGNLMMLEGGVVGMLDCGMVGRIDEGLREEIEALLLAAVNGDADELTEIVMRLGQTPPELDRDELRAELADFLGDYAGQTLTDFDLSGALHRMFSAIREFHIILPPSFGMLVKTLVLLEGTSRQVSPEFSLAALLKPYYAKAFQRRLAPRRLAGELQRSFRSWKRLIDIIPNDLVDILSRVRKGTFEVHMEHRRLESTVDRMVKGLLTAALFLGSSMMWSMNAPPVIYEVSLFGAMGFLVSVWMGANLLWLIRKDRKKRGP